jgi:hypothetical protein
MVTHFDGQRDLFPAPHHAQGKHTTRTSPAFPTMIQSEPPLPGDLSKAHGLVALYALQPFERMAPQYRRESGQYFLKTTLSFYAGLNNPTVETAKQGILDGTCVFCMTSVDMMRSHG